eukprot:2875230-Rhodomonas_salina.1
MLLRVADTRFTSRYSLHYCEKPYGHTTSSLPVQPTPAPSLAPSLPRFLAPSLPQRPEGGETELGVLNHRWSHPSYSFPITACTPCAHARTHTVRGERTACTPCAHARTHTVRARAHAHVQARKLEPLAGRCKHYRRGRPLLVVARTLLRLCYAMCGTDVPRYQAYPPTRCAVLV